MKVGQTIVEVLMALGMATVAILALVAVTTKSVANSGMAKRQAQATALAVEGIEWVGDWRRQVAWGGATGFYSKGRAPPTGRTYTLNSLPASWAGLVVVGCSGTISGTEYTRCVTLISQPAGTTEQVTARVDVTWFEGGRQVRSRQETVFVRN